MGPRGGRSSGLLRFEAPEPPVGSLTPGGTLPSR